MFENVSWKKRPKINELNIIIWLTSVCCYLYVVIYNKEDLLPIQIIHNFQLNENLSTVFILQVIFACCETWAGKLDHTLITFSTPEVATRPRPGL